MTGSAMGPGSVLGGRYHLEVLLSDARGARFWRATDQVLSRSVAIHAISSDDARADHLLAAARRSATVIDTHLLRVLDCDEGDGLTWVVNEWGDGTSLDHLLDRGPLQPMRAAWLAREVAEVIAHAHGQGTAHGHLNPESVLVSNEGEVKLIGFSVQAVLAPDRDPGLDAAAECERDVVDLAGILYAALTARWPGRSASRVTPSPEDNSGPLRARQVRAGVPRYLDAICDRVLRRRAGQHGLPIRSAQEIAAALANYVGDQTAPALPAAWHLDQSADARRPGGHDGPATGPMTGLDPGPSTAADVPTGALRYADDTGAQVGVAPAPPPPPFEEIPERPLFASDKPRPGHRPPEHQQVTFLPVTGNDAQEPPHEAVLPTSDAQGGGDSWSTMDEPHAVPYEDSSQRHWWRLAVALFVVMIVVAAVGFVLSRHHGQDSGPATPVSPGRKSSDEAAGAPVQPVSTRDFDPHGSPPEENGAQVPLATDGNPTTGWTTSTYYDQLGLAGLKAGVGVLLDLGKDKQVGSLGLQLTGSPTGVRILAAPPGTTSPPTSETSLHKLAGRASAGTSPQFTFPRTRTRYLVVWLTRLPAVPGGYRGQIDEIQVRS